MTTTYTPPEVRGAYWANGRKMLGGFSRGLLPLTTTDDALNVVGKEIIDGLGDGSAESRFLAYAKVATEHRTAAQRTLAAADLTAAFSDGGDCKKLIRWLSTRAC